MPSLISPGRALASQLENLCREKHLAAIRMWLLFRCLINSAHWAWIPTICDTSLRLSPGSLGKDSHKPQKKPLKFIEQSLQLIIIFLISKIQGLDFCSSNSSRCMTGRSRFTKGKNPKPVPPALPTAPSIHTLVSRLEKRPTD